jgi:hypothetical protein
MYAAAGDTRVLVYLSACSRFFSLPRRPGRDSEILKT